MGIPKNEDFERGDSGGGEGQEDKVDISGDSEECPRSRPIRTTGTAWPLLINQSLQGGDCWGFIHMPFFAASHHIRHFGRSFKLFLVETE